MDSACCVSSSCAGYDFSGWTICTSSTLSNWWLRIMPRVSLPAAPASERKHGEWQADFSGRLLGGTVSARTEMVTEYSQGGVAERAGASLLQRSPLNLAGL